ncbi:heavy-metal-associated domain-containing protein [Clostridium tetani]|uniref:Copper chaperone n=1 Tax=Clostridium tetani TaxID=1513 RepID=A0ABY0EV40_CLOTA|nr:heavy-metal-associated domain-containing protein [Clostridium tetani]CDI48271.1 metal-binding protein of ferredoxin foldprotein [Clostridium tetani 12124569]KHO40289.1 ferredoxin [Clostridium tetani]RXI41127.1 copper chaperone [Clostridium tetani]RXI58455.1 copper chaperone [Clostridium tetani]RXI73167.1 copper chaperone [Clostridium tetani]
MRSVIKVLELKNASDVVTIKKAISNKTGVLAIQINIEKREINVVYDDYLLTIDDMMDCIEDLGYSIL